MAVVEERARRVNPSWREKRKIKKELKKTRQPRTIARALLRVADVIIDSASGIPGVGVFKEVKEGTMAILDDVQDVDDGLLTPTLERTS